MITEEQLISKLQTLKAIKPRNTWAYSLKFEILNSKSETNPNFQNSEFSKPVSNFDIRISSFFFGLFAKKRLAYSFAAVLLLIAGAFGLVRLLPTGTFYKNSTASLTAQTNKTVQTEAEKKVVAALNSKIKDLKQSLIVNPKQDPQTIKGIADSLKTLADVSGTDLDQDIKDLYQTLVWSQIYDLQHSTLTAGQKKVLAEIEDLAMQGKYIDALEEILLINK